MKSVQAHMHHDKIKSFLESCFDMPSSTNVVLLHQGFHDTYKVEAVEKAYAFRIYRSNWKSYESIEGELKLLELLHQSKILVSYPIRDRNNSMIHELEYPEGTRYGVLFNYAIGKPLQSLAASTARLFGVHLAKIHNVTENLSLPEISHTYESANILSLTEDSLRSRLEQSNVVFDRIGEMEELLKHKLTPQILNQLPRGICHGDPHYENCFLDDRGTLTFFDFDFCGNGCLHYDLGSFYHYERDKPEVKKNFLEGYTEIRPLNETAIQAIPYFVVLMRLFHLGARASFADGIKSPIWPNEEIEHTTVDIFDQLKALDY